MDEFSSPCVPAMIKPLLRSASGAGKQISDAPKNERPYCSAPGGKAPRSARGQVIAIRNPDKEVSTGSVVQNSLLIK